MEPKNNIPTTLPCFKYIVQKIDKSNTSATASFALAYIQYLEKCGITEPAKIEQQFFKITLLSQFNPNSTESLDLLTVNGKHYTLSSPQQLDTYCRDLLKLCKKPRSFSALYKLSDAKLQVCKFCPMSEHFTLSYQKEEIQLLKFILTDSKSFRKIITCIDDIEKLFFSYDELYNIFGDITKPVCFPAISALVECIFQKTDLFFNPVLQARCFPEIKNIFEKKLRTYGIKAGIDNLPATYAQDIYDYVLKSTNDVPDLEDDAALGIKEKLVNRDPYSPPFDADATPQLHDKAPSAKKASDASGRKKTGRKKEIEHYHTTTALSHDIDVEMGLDTPLKEYKVEGSLETDNAQDIPVPSEEEFKKMESEIITADETDILSSDDEVIVEHTAQNDSTIAGFDDDIEVEFGADEEDEEYDTSECQPLPPEAVADTRDIISSVSVGDTSSDVLNEMGKDISVSSSADNQASGSETDSFEAVPLSGSGAGQSDSHEVAVEERPLQPKADDAGADDAGTAIATLTPISYNAILDLRLPLLVSGRELSDISIVNDVPATDRVISYGMLNGFCIMDIVVADDVTWFVFCAYNKLFRIRADLHFYKDIVSFSKFLIFSSRPLAVYSYLSEHEIVLKKGRIIPVDNLLFANKKLHTFAKLSEFYRVLYQDALQYFAKTKSEDLMAAALLYNVYGVSLNRNRYFTVKNPNGGYAFAYDEKGNVIQSAPEDENTITNTTGGCLLIFKYNGVAAGNHLYHKLTQAVLLSLAEKGCFNKFHVSVFNWCNDSFTLYADAFCVDYIYNVTLVSLFKESASLKIYPLNISLKKNNLSNMAESKS